ncbi:MAG: transcriptional regulator GcvA [Oceanospirillaceae bacterium]
MLNKHQSPAFLLIKAIIPQGPTYMARAQLPSLNSLRAFEVAARHMSFKLAADELCVTPTAISHRIKTLEDWLGIKLFNRLTRALELTKEGEKYARRVNEAFILLIEASDDLRNHNDEEDLVISTTMSFASNWLATRLLEFQTEHDQAKIKITAQDGITDLNRSNIDIAIRFGAGKYDGLFVKELFTDYVTPVCSAELAATLKTPQDLLKLALIDYQWADYSAQDPSWDKWFQAAQVSYEHPQNVPVFSDEHMVLSLAKAGKGVALIGMTAAADSIRNGELVRPFPLALKNHTHYFTCLPTLMNRPKVKIFYEWICEEANRFENFINNDERVMVSSSKK